METNNIFLGYILSAFIGYLLGCSNMAYYISKIKGINLREGGSKNLGASNVTYLIGKKAGFITCIHDILKAVFAVYVSKTVFPNLKYAYILAGVMAIIGHMFPFYLKFKGGKGFASYLGTMVVVNWKYFLVLLLIIIIVTLISDYIVFGTMATVMLSPVYVLITINIIPFFFLLIPSIIIILKHQENFVKIKNNEEYKVRSTLFSKKH